MDRKAKLKQAAELSNAGEIDTALQLLRGLISDNPQDKHAWWGIAATSKDPLEKRRAVNTLLALDPNHARALDLKAHLDADNVPATVSDHQLPDTASDNAPLPAPDDLDSLPAPALEGTQDISDDLADVLHADLELTDDESGEDWLAAVEDAGEIGDFGTLEPLESETGETFADWMDSTELDADEVPGWLDESAAGMLEAADEIDADADTDAPEWLVKTVMDDGEGDSDDTLSTTDLNEFLPLDDDPGQPSTLPDLPDDAAMDWDDLLGDVPDLLDDGGELDFDLLSTEADFDDALNALEFDDAADDSDWLNSLADADDDTDTPDIEDVTAIEADRSADTTSPEFEAPVAAEDAPMLDTPDAYAMTGESLLDDQDQADMIPEDDEPLPEPDTLLLSEEMQDSDWLQDYEAALEDLEGLDADIDLYDGLHQPNLDTDRDDTLPDDVPAGADLFADVVDEAAPPAVEDWLSATESPESPAAVDPLADVSAAEPPALDAPAADMDDDELAMLGASLLSDDDVEYTTNQTPMPVEQAEEDAALDWLTDAAQGEEELDAELPLAEDRPATEDDYLPDGPTTADEQTLSQAEAELEAALESIPDDDWMNDLPDDVDEALYLEEEYGEDVQLAAQLTTPPAPPEMPPELPETPAHEAEDAQPGAEFDFAAAFASESDAAADLDAVDVEALEDQELDTALDAYLPDSVRGFHDSVDAIWERDLSDTAQLNAVDISDEPPAESAPTEAPAAPEIVPQLQETGTPGTVEPEQQASVVRYEDTPQQQMQRAWYKDPDKRVQVAAGAAVGIVVLRFIVRTLFGRGKG